MNHLGDFASQATIDFDFSTQKADGTPITLAGTPAVSVYKANSTAETTTGPTLSVDFDGRTGFHHVRVATTDAFYASGNDFDVVITTGTVDGVSVVGRVLAHFSIENRSALRPTTAGRTLDIASTGEAGLDFANVNLPGSPSTLTNVLLPSTQKVDLETIKTRAVTDPGGTVAIGTNVAQVGSVMGKSPATLASTDVSGNLPVIVEDYASGKDPATLVAAHVAEGTITWDEILRLILAAEGAKTDGAAATTFHVRDSGDTKNRVTATVDADGNRTAVTLDLT